VDGRMAPRQHVVAATMAVIAVVVCPSAAVPVNTKTMKNFGHSIKNGHLVANTEIDLFEHTCANPPCTITQLHCPTAGPGGWFDANVKFYIDGDEPIEMTLLEMANIGAPTELGPPPPPPTLPNVSEYFLGAAGQSCDDVCHGHSLTCSPEINTGWGVDQGKLLQQRLATFNKSVASCAFPQKEDSWYAADQPCFVCGRDPNGNTGDCVGWANVPPSVSCQGTYPESCRVCHCVAPPTGPAPAEPGSGDQGPWGIDLFGHTAGKGGVYSTMRIPFQKSFKATLTSTHSGTFWFIVRGVEDYPVVLGDLELPDAAKLRLHRFRNHTEELELVTLMDVPAGTSGAVLTVRFDAKTDTSNYFYLEACMRALADGATTPLFLSSGAEDYFLSAYYFDEGEFKTPNSGLTYFDGHGTLSVYKNHDRDPLLWDDGFKLVFRNMEATTGCGDLEHCPNQFCANGTAAPTVPGRRSSRPAFQRGRGGSSDATYNTVIWAYEWPQSAVPRSAAAAGAGAHVDTDVLAFLVRLGEAGALTAAAEARLASRVARGDSAVTAAVKAHTGATDLQRAGRVLALLEL